MRDGAEHEVSSFVVPWGSAPSAATFEAITRGLATHGIVVLRGFIPLSLLDPIAVEYQRRLDRDLARLAHGDQGAFRGPGRHHLDLALGDRADDLDLVEPLRRHPLAPALLGHAFPGSWRCGPTQMECALPGCGPMTWHSDAFPPDLGRRKRSLRAALQIPLVHVDVENGPIEVDLGSHRMHQDEWLASCHGAPGRPCVVTTRRGDALLRDGDLVHRGTQNVTAVARPMISQLYARTGRRAVMGLSLRRVLRYARDRLALLARR